MCYVTAVPIQFRNVPFLHASQEPGSFLHLKCHSVWKRSSGGSTEGLQDSIDVHAVSLTLCMSHSLCPVFGIVWLLLLPILYVMLYSIWIALSFWFATDWNHNWITGIQQQNTPVGCRRAVKCKILQITMRKGSSSSSTLRSLVAFTHVHTFRSYKRH